MIVLDANVLIAFLDATDAHHAAALSLLDSRAHEGFAASALTAAEAMVHPARADRGAEGMAALREIALEVIPLTEQDVLGAARVRADDRLRMPDAVALHTARTSRASLATFDAALAGVARRAGVEVVSSSGD